MYDSANHVKKQLSTGPSTVDRTLPNTIEGGPETPHSPTQTPKPLAYLGREIEKNFSKKHQDLLVQMNIKDTKTSIFPQNIDIAFTHQGP